MKFLWVSLVSAVFFIGCSKEPFVGVVEEVLPKTAAVYVAGIARQTIVRFENGNFNVETATKPVVVIGAGVFVSPNNHILTCAHLFGLLEITGITICRENGICTAGEVLQKEDRLDLALVQSNFDMPTPYAKIADPRKLKVGQEVLAVGSPLGLEFSVSHGIISALNRDGMGVYNFTQSDAFLNPGNSGGPLFNLQGEIVGINSRILPPVPANIFTGLGFSVAPGQIREFLTRFRSKTRDL